MAHLPNWPGREVQEATFHLEELFIRLRAISPKQRHPKDRVFLPIINRGRRSLAVKNIHPAYGFLFTDLTQVDLGGFQILMAQDYLGHDF